MAIKIALATQKGGIGKTTSSLCIASELIRRGYDVLFIDTDPQENATFVYGAEVEGMATLADIMLGGASAEECIQHTDKGDIIPGDKELKYAETKIKQSPKMYNYIRNAIKPLEKKYDFIIFDTPRANGIILDNVLNATDKVIIPVTCDAFGIQNTIDFKETLDDFNDSNENLSVLGILIVKHKRNQNLTRDIENGVLADIAQEMNAKVFNVKIRETVKVQEAQAAQEHLYKFAPNCNAGRDYEALVSEILTDLNLDERKGA